MCIYIYIYTHICNAHILYTQTVSPEAGYLSSGHLKKSGSYQWPRSLLLHLLQSCLITGHNPEVTRRRGGANHLTNCAGNQESDSTTHWWKSKHLWRPLWIQFRKEQLVISSSGTLCQSRTTVQTQLSNQHTPRAPRLQTGGIRKGLPSTSFVYNHVIAVRSCMASNNQDLCSSGWSVYRVFPSWPLHPTLPFFLSQCSILLPALLCLA